MVAVVAVLETADVAAAGNGHVNVVVAAERAAVAQVPVVGHEKNG